MNDRRPDPDEYDARYERYMTLVPEPDLVAALEGQLGTTRTLIAGVPAAKTGFRYGPGKWTLCEVFGHILDTERLLAYRVFCFARGDQGAQQRADEELYVREGHFERYPLGEWLEEFDLVRRASVALLRHLPADAWGRSGTVSGLRITVRAAAYLLLGHERHHLRIIQEQYLAS